MFLRFRNILPKNQINKRFFSNNCKNNCNVDSKSLSNILFYIYLVNIINCSINFIQLVTN